MLNEEMDNATKEEWKAKTTANLVKLKGKDGLRYFYCGFYIDRTSDGSGRVVTTDKRTLKLEDNKEFDLYEDAKIWIKSLRSNAEDAELIIGLRWQLEKEKEENKKLVVAVIANRIYHQNEFKFLRKVEGKIQRIKSWFISRTDKVRSLCREYYPVQVYNVPGNDYIHCYGNAYKMAREWLDEANYTVNNDGSYNGQPHGAYADVKIQVLLFGFVVKTYTNSFE